MNPRKASEVKADLRADFYQHVYDVVEEKLTEAVIALQEHYGITDGGCDPLVSHQYDEALEDMAEAVRILIEHQRALNGKGA